MDLLEAWAGVEPTYSDLQSGLWLHFGVLIEVDRLAIEIIISLFYG